MDGLNQAVHAKTTRSHMALRYFLNPKPQQVIQSIKRLGL